MEEGSSVAEAELRRRDALGAAVAWALVDDVESSTGLADPVIDAGTRDLLEQVVSKLSDLITRDVAEFVYDQSTPATVWTINHGLGLNPAVVIVDSGGTQVYGTVDYVTSSQLVISFSSAFGGKAFLR
jgi:hypothetical protein